MEVRHLRCFVAVAEERSFTRAAGRLSVAQPSVSAQIRNLEEELGTPLFHRGPEGAALTQAGEVLLPHARRVLDALREAAADVRAVEEVDQGRLSVGATPSISTVLLPPVLGTYHRARPGVEIEIVEAGSRELAERLRTGEIELAVLILPVADASLTTAAVAEEELVLVLAPDHPLARRQTVAVSELADVALVMFRDGYDLRSATVAACRAAGFEPRLAAVGGEMDGVLALVAAGVGAAVVPSIVVPAARGLRAVRFDPPMLRRTIGCAHRADRHPSRAAEAFLAELTGMLRSGGWPGAAPSGLRVL
ncbi:MAG TPA: LysR substrate-binding domain-containing protein [Acidimicrobiales bacterium]|nr:LysR substrate-binding domain-containing protein [Acidimicrobiales bacterium]